MVLLIIGLVIGLVLGLTGAGGSVFAVPLLMIFLKLPAQDAMGMALAAVSLSATYGIVIRWRHKQFFPIPALLLGITGVITAPLGKWLANLTPEPVLHGLFAVLAIFLGIRMWHQATIDPEDTRVVRASAGMDDNHDVYLCRYASNGKFELRPRCIGGLLVSGLLVGLMSGFLGVGGGFLIIPILLFLSQMPMLMAVGTSLLIIAPVSFSGFISYFMMTPDVHLPSLISLIGGGITGMALGTRLARYLAGPQLQKIFAFSLIILVLINLGFR